MMAAVFGTAKRVKMRLRTKILLHSIGAGCALCGAMLGASIWDLNRRVSRAAKCLSSESEVERSRYIVPPDSVAAALSAAQRGPGEPGGLSYRKWSQLPFILLRLAQCDNSKLRQLAFRRLLHSNGMTSADFLQIAQAADFKTLLELARFGNADSRYFLEPRPATFTSHDARFAIRQEHEAPTAVLENFEVLLRDLLKMLLAVDTHVQPSLPSTTNEAVGDGQPSNWYSFATSFLTGSSDDGNAAQSPKDVKGAECRCCRYRAQLALDRTEPHKHFLEQEGFVGTELSDPGRHDPLTNEEARLVVLLDAIHAQSAHADRARRVVNSNGTLVIRDLVLATRSTELHRAAARVMLNLTAAFRGDESGMSELVRHISSGRWLAILHRWFSREGDPYLNLYSGNILANLSAIVTRLDTPELATCTDLYRDGMYLLYPSHRKLDDLDPRKLQHEFFTRVAEWLRESIVKIGVKVRFTTAHASSASPAKLDGVADVVFVHGLLGGVMRTWRARECPDMSNASLEKLRDASLSNTLCWPKDWLPSDLPNVRVLGIDYDTNLSRWQRACPYDEERNSLEARAAGILKQLERAGVGRDRPVIWIAHSLGGLLVKQILVLASKRRSTDSTYCDKLVHNTKGCVFYAVPHLGTDFARQFTRYRYLLSLTTEVEQLSSDSRYLDTLNGEFRKLILKSDIAEIDTRSTAESESKLNILSLVERDELALWKYKALIVPQHTADGGLGGQHLVVSEDHQRVCKPASPDSPNYAEVVRFIKKCLNLP